MNLKNVNHINKFRRLPYPKNEMLIVASGTLALLGLKKNKDLDVWISPNVNRRMSRDRRLVEKKSMLDGRVMYETKDGSMEFGSTFPPFKSFKNHMKRSIVIYGIHFQSPEDVLRWKKYMNRPKDREDVRKLEKYMKQNIVELYLNSLQRIS